jgi:hypothetical protein
LADIQCGHCGQAHAEGTKFCPKTGKALGGPAPNKATMIMFKAPSPAGTPGDGGVPGPPGPPGPSGPPRATTPGNTAAQPHPSAPAQPSPSTPTHPRASTPGQGRSTSPVAGTPLGERLSRMTPGVGMRVPEVPPPPVSLDKVPPPVTPTPPAGNTPGPRRPGPSGPLPAWVADPDTAGASFISSVFPAQNAPAKGVVDLLKDALQLYRRHARDFLLTAAVLFVPGALLSSVVLALITAPMRASTAALESAAASGDPAAAAAMAGAAVGGIMATLLMLLGWAVTALIIYGTVVPLTIGALTIAVADRALGGNASPWDCWRLLFSRLPRLLSALIPAALICMVGYLFLILPGVILSFLFVFTPAVVLIESQSGIEALKRSSRLVRADWLRVLVVLITFAVINWVAHLLGALLIPGGFFFLENLLGDLLTLVLLPLPVLATVLIYLDLRRRTEAVDAETLRRDLDTLRSFPDDDSRG